ncbi:MAG: hypothetical protein ABIB93_06295 [Chloroflexota bacterium]
MMTTKRAAERLKEELAKRCFDADLGFRVTGGNSEPGKEIFTMKLDNRRSDDEVIDAQGIKFFLDPSSATLLRHCRLDYLEKPVPGFLLKNPLTGERDTNPGNQHE